MAVSADSLFTETPSALHQIGECAAQVGAERPGTVADVLIPRKVVIAAGGLQDRLEAGWRFFGRGRRRGLKFSTWGQTYFERLTGRWVRGDMTAHDLKENRLASIVEKMTAWGKDFEAAFYLHTDSPTDRLRPRGAPCLQYVQLRSFDGNQLELFALYRAHDYLNKTLGNMIGLQRLGNFIASETGRTFVRQTVFSLHPFSGGSKQALKDFAESVTAALGV